MLHLITDRKAVSSTALSARHAIMQGLKTCLRTASQHGIHNVIIPLLLVHTMEPVSDYSDITTVLLLCWLLGDDH